MTRERWRYIDSGPCAGAENMALDQAIFESHAQGTQPPTLRVYAWRPSAVSLGRFQRMDSSVDLETCRTLGIDIVKRPTGGRAILHTEKEVTFSIVVSEQRLGTRGVMDSYRALAIAIVTSMRGLRLDARLVERASPTRTPLAAQDPACFAVKARCDLIVGTSKLVGSAQVQREGFILQQNSLPLEIPLEDWKGIFLRKNEAPAAVGLWEAVGEELSYSQVAAALRDGFAETFGVAMDTAEPSQAEYARAKELEGQVLVSP